MSQRARSNIRMRPMGDRRRGLAAIFCRTIPFFSTYPGRPTSPAVNEDARLDQRDAVPLPDQTGFFSTHWKNGIPATQVPDD